MKSTINVLNHLTVAVAVVDEFGFVSKKAQNAARARGISPVPRTTAERTQFAIDQGTLTALGITPTAAATNYDALDTPTDVVTVLGAHRERARTIAQHFATADNKRGKFELKLESIFSNVEAEPWVVGYICAAVNAYDSRVEWETANAELLKHVTVGPGDKLAGLNVTLDYGRVCETRYGECCIYGFSDENGLAYIWFTKTQLDASAGDAVYLAGTVKSVDSYKGKPQVKLTRCAVDLRQ